MANPLLYGGTQPNKATNPVAAVNNLNPAVPRQKNTFDLTHQRCQTERFADLTPFFVLNCVGNDDVMLTSNVDQRPVSTFSSPLMTTFRKHRGYFAVPRSVIYKEIWQQVFVNPKKGDDINFNNVICSFNAKTYLSTLQSGLSSISDSGPMTEAKIQEFVGYIILLRCLCDDSILSYLDLNPIALRSAVTNKTLSDAIWDIFQSFPDDLSVFTVQFQGPSGGLNVRKYDMHTPSGFNQFFDDTLSEGFDIKRVSIGGAVSSEASWPTFPPFPSFSVVTAPINLERLIAYQMCCAQFFTSDDVDNVFTANLWRQNSEGIINSFFDAYSSAVDLTFTWNGLSLYYHPYSYSMFNRVVGEFNNYPAIAFNYFFNLFQPQHSLRYGDMFNASRLEPLAVGDYSAAVSDNAVSAVDVTKAILMQRFLNDINATRNTIEGYNKLLYGVAPDDAPTEPRFVAHSVVEIGSSLVANTSEDQGNLATNLALHDSRKEFSVHLNQETILLGISWYDCVQLYANPVSPFAFHIDRFDGFNPFLQNIGDVPVPLPTLPLYPGFVATMQNTFGYLQNDYEYKQEINRAYGGYINGSLTGATNPSPSLNIYSTWAFIRRFRTFDDLCLSPDFIRNSNWEFDVFFKSLTGHGSNYFHFICSYVNEVLAARPMEYVSGILFNNR